MGRSSLIHPRDSRTLPDLRMLQPTESFLKGAIDLGIEFEQRELDALGEYLALLLDANTRFNLTSVTDPDEAWTRHILDSLTLLPFIHSAQATSAVDVGSGGGLPGIPLAIALPDVQITLLEVTGKKARFLEEVANKLRLQNVRVVSQRAESAGQDPAHRERYDIVLARAVGKLPVLLELTVPFARVGGHVLAMKGEKAAQEIAEAKQALHMLHVRVAETANTPGGVIVVIDKQRKTPGKYPRSPGEPGRLPLGC